MPRGQSVKARVLVTEQPKKGSGAVDLKILDECQKDASAGRYAQAMAGFVRWLAPRYEELRRHLRAEINTLRERAYQSGQHRRMPDIVANLALGFSYFLNFAQEVEAINEAEAQALWNRAWTALGDAAAAQEEHQRASDPVRRYVELLGAAISGGRAHLSDDGGKVPTSATSWGWRVVEVGAGDNYGIEYRPQGEHIGWLDGEDIYLQSDAAFAVVQRLARDQGDNISITLATLKKRLRDQGLLASTDKHMAGGREVERMEVRRDLQGKRRRVLHVNRASLAIYASESEPGEPGEPQLGIPYLWGSQNGSHSGSQTAPAPGFVSQKSEPNQAPSVPDDEGSGSLGSLGSQNPGYTTPRPQTICARCQRPTGAHEVGVYLPEGGIVCRACVPLDSPQEPVLPGPGDWVWLLDEHGDVGWPVPKQIQWLQEEADGTVYAYLPNRQVGNPTPWPLSQTQRADPPDPEEVDRLEEERLRILERMRQPPGSPIDPDSGPEQEVPEPLDPPSSPEEPTT